MKLLLFLLLFGASLYGQRNIGPPYGCTRATDYGFTTDNTTASQISGVSNGALLITWITNALTPGTSENKNTCLFIDDQLNVGTTQIASPLWWAKHGNIVLTSTGGDSNAGSLFGAGLTLAQVHPHGINMQYQSTNGIARVSIGTAGTGYTVGDIVNISGGTGGTAVIFSVSAGVPTGIVVATPGTGYSSTGGLTTTGGTGTGLIVTVNSADNRIPKFVASWQGSLVTRDITFWSSAGVTDVNTYLGTQQTSHRSTNLTIIGAQTTSPVNKQTGINYGMGSVLFGGYNTWRMGTVFSGLCTAAVYDGNVGSAPNSIEAISDWYGGGDTTTPSNCQIYDLSASVGNVMTNNTFKGGVLELSNCTATPPAACAGATSVSSVFKLGLTANTIIVGNGFWDSLGGVTALTGTSQTTNVFMDDSNFFSMGDAAIATGLSFGKGNILPQHLFVATTSSFAPGALANGACATTTVAVAYATAGYPTMVNATTKTAGFNADASITSNGTATVRVCNASGATNTPTASTYQVFVQQTGVN